MEHFWTSSSGRIEIKLTADQAIQGSHPGPCDLDIAELRQDPQIAEQLAQLKPETLRDELKEYGAWDEVELADHEANLDRILWIACGDLMDQEVTE